MSAFAAYWLGFLMGAVVVLAWIPLILMYVTGRAKTKRRDQP